MATDYEKIKKQTLELVADILIDELKLILVQEGKLKPKGGLVESLEYRIGDTGVVVLGADYAEEYIDGKPKGVWVPLDGLLKWVQRYRQFKPLYFRNSQGQFLSNRSIAAIVQRAIFKNGIDAKPYFDRVLTGREKEIQELITEEFERAVELEIEKELTVKEQ